MRDITVKILNNVEGKLLQLHIAQTGYPLYDMLWENDMAFYKINSQICPNRRCRSSMCVQSL
jgi:hypothetical protein